MSSSIFELMSSAETIGWHDRMLFLTYWTRCVCQGALLLQSLLKSGRTCLPVICDPSLFGWYSLIVLAFITPIAFQKVFRTPVFGQCTRWICEVLINMNWSLTFKILSFAFSPATCATFTFDGSPLPSNDLVMTSMFEQTELRDTRVLSMSSPSWVWSSRSVAISRRSSFNSTVCSWRRSLVSSSFSLWDLTSFSRCLMVSVSHLRMTTAARVLTIDLVRVADMCLLLADSWGATDDEHHRVVRASDKVSEAHMRSMLGMLIQVWCQWWTHQMDCCWVLRWRVISLWEQIDWTLQAEVAFARYRCHGLVAMPWTVWLTLVPV